MNLEAYQKVKASLNGATLVAVSKTKPAADIMVLYEAGQRDFGENYIQELLEKKAALPLDIRWHVIGHLQTNKVKYIAPFVHLIHSVDSQKLLEEINKQAKSMDRIIDCLFQVHIAKEDTKTGFSEPELLEFLDGGRLSGMQNIRIRGLMGMATLTDDLTQVRSEYKSLKSLFERLKVEYFQENPAFDTLSMGMSSDYLSAIEEGSNMVRIGSLLFGSRV